MTLRQKRYWFTIGGSSLLILVFSVATIMSFKHFTLDTVRDQARMTAELLRVSLTEQMRNGTIENREELFKRLRIIPGLQDVRVLRGEPVVHQFGKGHQDEVPRLDMEKRVLATGQWEEELLTTDESTLFRITIPYIARSTGNVNCLQCHHVPEGAVNGAITLAFEMDEMEESALFSIVPVIMLLCLFGLSLGYFLKRILSPIVETSEKLEVVVGNARRGDFSGRIETESKDEIDSIAQQTNLLMQTLDESIGTISNEIKSLGDGKRSQIGEGMLTHTVTIVKEMVSAAKFKQMVENDVDLEEIYGRIKRVLTDHFHLTRFSFYEVTGEGREMTVIFVEGLEHESELWCDPEIIINADQCRAKRTAACVDASTDVSICNRFCGAKKDLGDFVYICIPMMISGAVGGVLQVVLTPEEAAEQQDLDETIRIYLQEAVPVIESRKLMQSLKETTLRDPMTGLYNRRFLEDYIENMLAGITRRKSTLGVLMLDIDFFKQVNDTYGHDIGDQVLKELSDILKGMARNSDLLIRYGGEEFMMLLPDTDQEGSMNMAERIRKTMEEATVTTPKGSLQKTLSVGVSVFPIEEGKGFWETVKCADVALYKAKERGRNKVLAFDTSMWGEGEGDQY